MLRYCSTLCRSRANYAKKRADGRYERELERARETRERVTPTEKTCLYCGVSFRTTHPQNQKTCGSAECRRRHHNARMGTYNTARRRGAVMGETFSRIEIFERDDWTCGFCGDPVDPDLAFPDPMSASIDHVVPVALGGAHTRDNVQCSHLICNMQHADETARLAAVA